MIEIIDFEDRYAGDFKALNVAWLDRYFEVEKKDKELLSDPVGQIIANGGHIYFAKKDDQIVGTFALMKHGEDSYELGKMAVDEHYQGLKIGNKLLEYAIDKVRSLNAKKIILFSHTKLLPAIHLYKKFGFKEIDLSDSEYQRSNIKMELDLQQTQHTA